MKIHIDKRPQGQFTYVFDIMDAQGMAYINTFNQGEEDRKSLNTMTADLEKKIEGLHPWSFIERFYYNRQIMKLYRIKFKLDYEMNKVRVDIACHVRDNYLSGSLPTAIIYRGNRVAVSLFNKNETKKWCKNHKFIYTSVKWGDI